MQAKNSSKGFSLLEMMIALAILTFGLLAAAPLLYTAATSNSLARSKTTAAIAAQNKLECLSELYQRDPSAAELAPGSRGSEQTEIVNPIDADVLNRYNLEWTVSPVPDPRPGKIVDARLVRVKVIPIDSRGMENSRPPLNKILDISAICSSGAE
jgi:prepilin-type N-terminal cleavage/methylation domain-containing protein